MKVPVGTEVYEEDGESLIVDMDKPGMRYRLLKGGNGGFGNYHFKSATNQAPEFALPGQPAEEKIFILKLQTDRRCRADRHAQCRQVHLPQPRFGRQAQDRRLSFTTLEPQLGVVKIDETDFVLGRSARAD
jgi:GTP-binding protein